MPKGQLSFEFMIIFSFVLLVFLLLFFVITNQKTLVESSQSFQQLQLVAQQVASQIDQAASAGNGYSASFPLTGILNGFSAYNVSITKSGIVILQTKIGEQIVQAISYTSVTNIESDPSYLTNNAYILPISNGTISIQNEEGEVCIDYSCPINPGRPSQITLSADTFHAASFNGKTSSILAKLGSSITPSSVTITGWVNCREAGSTVINCGYMAELIGSDPVALALSGSRGREPEATFTGSPSYFAAGLTVHKDTWYFIGVTFSSSGTDIYVNSTQYASSDVATLSSYSGIDLGSYQGEVANHFNGTISNVQIYSNALSASSMSAIYAEGINGAPLDTNSLVAWYPLTSDTSDYSGNGNNPNSTVDTPLYAVSQISAQITNSSGMPVANALVGFAANRGYLSNGVAYANNGIIAKSTAAYTNQNGIASVFLNQYNSTGYSLVTATAFNGNLSTSNSLVGWWPMNLGTGNTIYDISGNNANGNAAYTSWAMPRYIAKFDGQTGYIDVPNAVITDAPWTISAWYMQDNTTPSDSAIIEEGVGDVNSGVDGVLFVGAPVGCGSASSNLGISYYVYGVAWRCVSAPINQANYYGTWHNIVGTYDGTNLDIYIDGYLANTINPGSGSMQVPTQFHIGAGTYSASNFNGSIANVQAYKTALSSNQVYQLYSEGISGPPVNSLIAGWWPLDGNANDYSGNGNNGSIYGGVTFTSPSVQANSNNVSSAFVATFNGLNSEMAAIVPQLNSTPGGYNTVSFWMDWNGLINGMPITLLPSTYDLQIVPCESGSTCIGFNTNNGDIYGTISNGLADTWVNIDAEFYNGYYTGNSIIYINGIAVPLSQIDGAASGALASNSVKLGNGFSSGSAFAGDIANLQVYNTSLSAKQASTIYSRGIVGSPLQVPNLVAWYPLNGNANDYSKNGNNGVASNVIYEKQQADIPPPLITALGGSGSYFSGQTSNVVVPNYPLNMQTNAYNTFSFWANPSNISNWNSGEVFFSPSHSNPSYSLVKSGSCIGFNNGPADVYGFVNTQSLAQTWDFFTVEIMNEGGGVNDSIYVNGVKQPTFQCIGSSGTASAFVPTSASSPSTSELVIGEYQNNAGAYFGGQIADFQVYNSMLTPSQIQQLYSAGIPPSASITVPLSILP